MRDKDAQKGSNHARVPVGLGTWLLAAGLASYMAYIKLKQDKGKMETAVQGLGFQHELQSMFPHIVHAPEFLIKDYIQDCTKLPEGSLCPLFSVP